MSGFLIENVLAVYRGLSLFWLIRVEYLAYLGSLGHGILY